MRGSERTDSDAGEGHPGMKGLEDGLVVVTGRQDAEEALGTQDGR